MRILLVVEYETPSAMQPRRRSVESLMDEEKPRGCRHDDQVGALEEIDSSGVKVATFWLISSN